MSAASHFQGGSKPCFYSCSHFVEEKHDASSEIATGLMIFERGIRYPWHAIVQLTLQVQSVALKQNVLRAGDD